MTSQGKIQDISVKNTYCYVRECWTLYAAGIVCVNNGLIDNCQCDGLITAIHSGSTDIDEDYFVGGITCVNNGVLINSSHKGDINALPSLKSMHHDVYAGGIVAYNKGEVYNCSNDGNITAQVSLSGRGHKQQAWVGGICGYSTNIINNVFNLANISLTGSSEYVIADGICAYGKCVNAFYPSSSQINSPTISKNGTMLSIEQMRNQTLDFTSLLNYNVDLIDFSPKTYWANSPDFNNNEPFLINSLNIELQTANVTQSSISVVCQPLQMTSSWIIEKGFEYQKQGSHITQTAIVNDNFSADLLDLEADAVYEVRAFVKGKTGVVYSKNLNIKTSAPTIQTLDATEITPVSATLNGKIDVGNTPIKSQGFLWKKQGGNYNVVLTQGSEYSVKIENLLPSTIYIYQAYAIDELDRSIYGNEVNFKTLPINVVLDKMIATPYSIELYGHINLNMVTEVIVEYRDSNSGAFVQKKVSSQSNGQFSTTIDGLWADTEYEIRAYFVYDKSTVYSPQETISTLPLEITTLIPLVDKYVEFYASVVGKVQSGEFGFEYREINIPDIIPSKYIVCSINDNRLAGIPTELENGRKYKVRAYYKSPSNKYSYGQWIDFLPTDLAAVDNIEIDNEEEVIAVYNAYGQRVNTFTKGINLVILSNGQTKKIIF